MFARCELANAIRTLSMNAVQQAKTVHPGAPWVWLTLPKSCGVLS